MRVIYEPRGPALEYCALAVSLYSGPCPCQCRYCYVPDALRLHGQKREAWKQQPFAPRKDILKKLERDCQELQQANDCREILVSFMHDIDDNPTLLNDAMMILAHYERRITVLTKRPAHLRHSFSFMRRNGFRLAVSLSWVDDAKRKFWEPEAHSVGRRMAMLAAARQSGVETWASVEPVIDTWQALGAVAGLIPVAQEIRVGGLNAKTPELKEIKARIDWKKFVRDLQRVWKECHGDRTSKLVLKAALAKYANAQGHVLTRSAAEDR